MVDPDGHVGVGSISVRVLAAGDTNQPPVARRDVERARTGQVITVSPLGNDSDPEGGGLTIVSVLTPAHGTVPMVGRTFNYTPDASFSGTETITYVIRDNHGLLATGTVRSTVRGGTNRPPAADTQYLSVTPGPRWRSP